MPNKPSDREWALMDMQQKITFEVIRDKAKDSLEKYKRNVALLEQVLCSLWLDHLLVQYNDFMHFSLFLKKCDEFL